MKHTLLKKTMLFAASFAALYSSAQEINISGEIRPRSEMRKGYKALATSPDDLAFFTDQRSRINFDYKSENIRTYFVLQDVRTWGSQSQLQYNEASTTLHEAWAEAFLSKKFGLKVGRQELVYDDHRILGSVAWTQQARSHDLALLKYKDSTWNVHLGLAFNQDGPQSTTTLYTVPKSYKTMQFLWANRDFGKTNMSLLFLNNGLQVEATDKDGNPDNFVNYSQTMGTRLVSKLNDQSKLIFFGYYQMGEAGDSAKTKINAFDLSLEYQRKLNDKTGIDLGYEILSGNDQVDGNSENNAFAPLYGTNHKFNGFMDYFYVGNHGGSVGLQDAYIRFKRKIGKVNLRLDVHGFFSAAPILDQKELAESGESKAASSFLGTEFDLTLKTKLNPQTTLVGGYSVMLASDSMEYLKGGRKELFQNWGYVMLVFKPSFLNTKVAAKPIAAN